MGVDKYGSTVIAACEQVWKAIRKNHTDLPDVIFTLGDGKGEMWGYFAQSQWHSRTDRTGVPQVMIAGERLQHGQEGVIETLLHEAAHALAFARGIQDTSRQGRYHNKRFSDLAAGLGLRVEKSSTHGHAHTSLMPGTIDLYARQLHDLERVLDYYKRTPTPKPKKDKKEPAAKAECGCGRSIPATYIPVICGECHTDFEEVTNA